MEMEWSRTWVGKNKGTRMSLLLPSRVGVDAGVQAVVGLVLYEVGV